jgi:predicted amidohydrolase
LKAAFIQTSPVFGEVKANVDKAVSRIAKLDASLIVLPELFSTGYQFRSKKELLDLAEEVPAGYATRALIEAAKARGAYIVAGLAERAGRKAYNSAVLVGPRGLIGTYRKAHLFWDEKKIFAKGDTPFKVYKAGGVRVGMMICFDWLFRGGRTLAPWARKSSATRLTSFAIAPGHDNEVAGEQGSPLPPTGWARRSGFPANS